MIGSAIRRSLFELDMQRRRRRNLALVRNRIGADRGPKPAEPIWPLPRRAGGLDDDQIRARFAEFDQWHYAYAFEGGLSFETRHSRPAALADETARPLRRFRHFMPWLIEACGGNLAGKSVLDIACNSGFWSIQCALLGAERVVGFDARDELVEQANLLKTITGLPNVEFRRLDFWKMSPETLGGAFDVVLNLGILYHLPKPIEAMELTRAMARDLILLDTAVYASRRPLISLRWEETADIRCAAESGIVAYPTKAAMELMFRHLRFTEWNEIPLLSRDMPADYLGDRRASWLLRN